jgi:hypothetical protein
MTRQSNAPIERMQLSATSRLASELARYVLNGRLTVELPYQRGAVWTYDQQIALVHSWLSGTPIASVILNDRMSLAWTDRNGEIRPGEPLWAVVDGKQRLLTAVAWFSGELAVPASWFPPEHIGSTEPTSDGAYVRFEGLSQTGQRIFENRAQLPAATASVASVEAEAEIYLRVNGGGTAQTDADMARAARVAGGE